MIENRMHHSIFILLLLFFFPTMITIESSKAIEQETNPEAFKIMKEKDMALVERVNMVKRHTKPGGKAGQSR